jgi:hypothetical protein
MESAPLAAPNIPVIISPDFMMGKMPKADRVLKQGTLWKLTSKYSWKPMQAVLTTSGLFLARPGEDILRDLIPLYEVVDIRKRRDLPGEEGRKKNSIDDRLERKIICDNSDLHILQIRTMEDGYNSGRTYYLNTRFEDACNEWLGVLRIETDKAILMKQAGPKVLTRVRYYIRKWYRLNAVQCFVALLIFASFLVTIIQTEMAGPLSSEPSPAQQVGYISF